MDVSDSDLVVALLARDGRQTYRKHSLEGRCRYAEFYPDGCCPWCEAEDKKLDRAGS